MAYFHSLDSACRRPVGALPAGETVTFTLTLSPGEAAAAPQLLLFEDDRSPQPDRVLPLTLWESGPFGSRWRCTLLPDSPGLWFYCFRLGERTLRRRRDGSAGWEGGLWQLTVYSPGFSTPCWLPGGVVYQIFPDRFAASGQPKTQVLPGRKLHPRWEELPLWQPDPVTGEIENDDFFGGDLEGIRQRLPYLAGLGVTALYLNPIFAARSNHRYDTADYLAIDPLLGSEEDFAALCADAAARGIRVILDGVFNHTGSDSRYFNALGSYPEPGAAQSQQSPYYPWYRFSHWPDRYDSWWGFPTLPALDHREPSLEEFLCGPSGVVAHWMDLGAGGWRLDVADELPDSLLFALRRRVKEQDPQALLLGEVWEDASHKISYGQRRQYLLGDQLDSVMNYPLMEEVLRFVRHGDAPRLVDTLSSLWENYPPPVLHCLLNSLSTHDTLRAITRLAGEPYQGQNRSWQAARQILPREDYLHGVVLFKLAAVLQYTLFGVPCLYYGDELGLTGYRDPFNRGTMPWGTGDTLLRDFFVQLGALRKNRPSLAHGDWLPLAADEDLLLFARTCPQERLTVAVNRGTAWRALPLPPSGELLLGQLENGGLPGMGFAVLLTPN